MTRKLKILLISVLFVVATVCVCAFAGCKVKYTVDELKEKYGLTAQVTYFLNSNDGTFNDNAFVKDLYFEAGQKPMNIGSSDLISGSSDLKINVGFNFTGWYEVEKDSAGNPRYTDGGVYSDGDKYDGTKKIVMSDKPYDFSKPLEEGEHVYVCGDFFKDVRLVQKLICIDEGDGTFNLIGYTDGDTTVTVKDGEEIAYGSRNIPKTGGLDDNTAALQDRFQGYTVEGFYQKVGEEYVPFTDWPVKYPTTTNAEGKYDDVELYVKMLKGEWDIISTPANVARMFNGGSKNYYIKQDIDGNGREISYMRTGLTGKIWGGTEGRKLSNFVVKSTIERSAGGAAIFGNIGENAVIKNVSFENFNVEFTVASGTTRFDPESGTVITTPNDADISFVANKISEKATIDNVSISGNLNITLSDNSSVTATTADNWLFGDQDDKTYDKIKVLSATCTVKDKDGNVVKDGSGNDRIYTHTVENKNIQTEEL